MVVTRLTISKNPLLPYLCLFLAIVSLFSCTNNNPDPREIEDKIRTILQLETAEFVYRDLVYTSTRDEFLGLVTKDTRSLVEIKLRVIAGIDVQQGLKVSLGADEAGQKKLTVTLPRARILVVDADESSIKQFLLQEFALLERGRVSLLQFTDQLDKNKTQARTDAIRRGILEKAETNARTIVKNLLRLSTDAEPVIQFSDKLVLESTSTTTIIQEIKL